MDILLRSFVYLDIDALNDYLSSITGSIHDEESVTEKKLEALMDRLIVE